MAVRDSGIGKIYINAILDASSPVSISSSTDPVLLGVDYQPDARYFDGAIDNVMIFNRTLAQEEIEELYDEGEI